MSDETKDTNETNSYTRFMHRQGKTVFCPKGHRVTILDQKKDEVLKDLSNLELSLEDVWLKWDVTHYTLVAFAERQKVDLQERREKYMERRSKKLKAKKKEMPAETRKWLGNEQTMCGSMMSLRGASLPWSRMAEAIDKPKDGKEVVK